MSWLRNHNTYRPCTAFEIGNAAGWLLVGIYLGRASYCTGR